MTTTELRNLRELATQGEWSWEDSPFGNPTLYAGREYGTHLLGRLEPDQNTPNNLNLIVAVVNALPKLLECAEAVKQVTGIDFLVKE